MSSISNNLTKSPIYAVLKNGLSTTFDNHYESSCPAGSYVTKFNGRVGSKLDKIGYECDTGEKFSYGGDGGDAWIIDSIGAGFQTLMSGGFNGGKETQWFNGFGEVRFNDGWPPDVFKHRCPTGTFVTGIEGSSWNGTMADQINVRCDGRADNCINDLESEYCKWLMPSMKISNPVRYADILDKACGVHMTDTCKDNQEVLKESTVDKYCQNHMDDLFCSCYTPPPKSLTDEVKGLPQCWNVNCSLHGYKSGNAKKSCPNLNVTVCRQDIESSGTSNNISKNVSIINCNPTNNTTIADNGSDNKKPSDNKFNINGMPSSNDSKGGNSNNSNNNSNDDSDDTNNKPGDKPGDKPDNYVYPDYYMYVGIFILFLLFIGIMYAIFGRSNAPTYISDLKRGGYVY